MLILPGRRVRGVTKDAREWQRPGALYRQHALDRLAGARATAGSMVTSWRISSSAVRMLASVMRFMCGHRLQGRTNSTSGCCTATLSLIEHSVISTTRAGCVLADIRRHRGGGAGEIGLRHHLGRAFGMRQHDDPRMVCAQLRGFPRR